MGSPGRRTTPGDDDLWQQCRAKVFLGVVSTLVADALWFIAQHPQKSAYWPMPLLSRHAVLCLIIPMRGARLLICSRPRLLPWNLQVRTAKQLGYLVRNLIIAPPLWAVSLRSRLDRRRAVCVHPCALRVYPVPLNLTARGLNSRAESPPSHTIFVVGGWDEGGGRQDWLPGRHRRTWDRRRLPNCRTAVKHYWRAWHLDFAFAVARGRSQDCLTFSFTSSSCALRSPEAITSILAQPTKFVNNFWLFYNIIFYFTFCMAWEKRWLSIFFFLAYGSAIITSGRIRSKAPPWRYSFLRAMERKNALYALSS